MDEFLENIILLFEYFTNEYPDSELNIIKVLEDYNEHPINKSEKINPKVNIIFIESKSYLKILKYIIKKR